MGSAFSRPRKASKMVGVIRTQETVVRRQPPTLCAPSLRRLLDPTDHECNICYTTKQGRFKTACNHVHCKECATEPLEKSGDVCPVCKQKVEWQDATWIPGDDEPDEEDDVEDEPESRPIVKKPPHLAYEFHLHMLSIQFDFSNRCMRSFDRQVSSLLSEQAYQKLVHDYENFLEEWESMMVHFETLRCIPGFDPASYHPRWDSLGEIQRYMEVIRRVRELERFDENVKRLWGSEGSVVDLDDVTQPALRIAQLKGNECAVCREPYASPCETPCEHVFCLECALAWMRDHNDCPACRATAVYVSGLVRLRIVQKEEVQKTMIQSDLDDFEGTSAVEERQELERDYKTMLERMGSLKIH